MNVSPLFIFILGVLIGFLLALYVLDSSKTKETPAQSGADLQTILNQQMAYQQQQNMLRELQLQAARQDAEHRDLEQKRLQYLAQTARLNQYDLRKALEVMGEGDRQC